jgi:hypothetical protein
MDFYSTHLYELIRSKASFKMLRDAEQVVALCKIQYYLEEDSIGHAISVYEHWQKNYPDYIESASSSFNLEQVCRIHDEEFNSMPWIYAKLLQTLCADKSKPDEDETTAESELNYITVNSLSPWLWSLPENVSYSHSFDYTYKDFMEKVWICDFLKKIKIIWPLTTAWYFKEETEKAVQKDLGESEKAEVEVQTDLGESEKAEVEVQTDLGESERVVSGEIIWPTTHPLPLIPASPPLNSEQLETDAPLLNLDSPKVVKKVSGAGEFWPYMRCKNVYKAHGGLGRISYHDVIEWIAFKWNLSVEELKKTNPYTLKEIRGLPTNYAYHYINK